MVFDPAALTGAEPFLDPYPTATATDPPPLDLPDRPYRPAALIVPRFWSPYGDFSSGETRIGAVTGGADALFRHAWVAEAHYGTGTDRLGGRVFYQYDRFRPTFTLDVDDKSDLAPEGFTHSREVTLRATLPVHRTFRVADSVSLAW